MGMQNVLCGSQCWTPTEQKKGWRLRLLRTGPWHWLIDHRQNEDIWGEQQIVDINSELQTIKHKCHKPCEEKNESTQLLSEYKPKDRREQGRPCTQRRQQFWICLGLEIGTGISKSLNNIAVAASADKILTYVLKTSVKTKHLLWLAGLLLVLPLHPS
jgi:hypothetical protein